MDRPATSESPITRERAALVDLVQSPGWALLVEYFRGRTTAEVVLYELSDIVNTGEAGSATLDAKVRTLMAERTALREVLLWPQQKIASLDAAREQGPDVPRGIELPPPGQGPQIVRRG